MVTEVGGDRGGVVAGEGYTGGSIYIRGGERERDAWREEREIRGGEREKPVTRREGEAAWRGRWTGVEATHAGRRRQRGEREGEGGRRVRPGPGEKERKRKRNRFAGLIR